MTPAQKLKHMVLIRMSEWDGTITLPDVTAENIDKLYDEQEDKSDAVNDLRAGDVETGLPCQWSRHYESKSVAAKAPDDSWVGWTYWYGGGKHGEPEAIDWISEAYDLDCVEEKKMVIVQTFTRIPLATIQSK